MLAFHWVADPQISPDGSLVAYTLVSVNDKDNRYETAVWMVQARAGAVPQRLTGGPRDGAPRWAPDGRTLAFTRAADDTSAAQIYLLSLAGGEPRKLTNVAKGAGPAVWSPDGHTIAFTSTTLPHDTAASMRDSVAKKLLTDVHVITRAEYRSNDRGWLDPARHDHVWLVDAAAAGENPVPAQQLTSGEFDEDGIVWSRDGSQIVFASNRVAEPYYNNPDADVSRPCRRVAARSPRSSTSMGRFAASCRRRTGRTMRLRGGSTRRTGSRTRRPDCSCTGMVPPKR